MKKVKIYFWVILSLFCIFTACDDDANPSFASTQADLSIQELLKQGWLLRNIEQKDGKCIFHFEESDIEIPAQDIVSIQPNTTEWNTIVTYSNGEVREIPTIGNSISKMVSTVTVNPSGYNPLVAQIRMNFPQGGVVRTIVHTKNGYKTENIEHTNAFSYQTVQFIDVLGLYANYINNVEIIYADKNGRERGRSVIEIPVAALNINYLPKLEVTTVKYDKMEPGLNLLNFPGRDEDDTSCPFMVDADGEIRWLLDWRDSKELLHIGAQCGLNRMKNGHFIVGDANNNQLVEVDLLGNIMKRWDLAGLGYRFHHEVMEASNGNLLVTVTKPTAALTNSNRGRINDHIVEIDPHSNKILKEWDLVNMLDSARYSEVDAGLPGAALGQTRTNWAHNNAISEWGSDYLASARFQGIFKFDQQGNLKWIISPHKNWRKEYEKYLLQPLDRNGTVITNPKVISGEESCEDFDWAWGVHRPFALPNGHIIAFDNGYCRNFIPLPYTAPNLYSRVVEYEIDEDNMTIRQVWQYGKERGRTCYAPAMSNVEYLKKTGHRLFCSGMGNKMDNNLWGGHIIEVDPQTNEVVFEMKVILTGGLTAFHRAVRMPLYPEDM